MRIFYTREFNRAIIDSGLGEADLVDAAVELNAGLWDAALGGQVYKKRVAFAGRGKRGGARTLVAFKRDDIVFFMYGFAKKSASQYHTAREQSTQAHGKGVAGLWAGATDSGTQVWRID